MDGELQELEDRVGQMLALCGSLRAENLQLRGRVAGLEGEKRRLSERIEAAAGRLEVLMARLPP